MQTTTETSSQEDSTTTQSEQTLNEWFTAWQERVESGEWRAEIVTEIYDTTQPADSTTGTPPLLSRVRETHEATSRSKTQAMADAEKRDSINTTATATASEKSSGKRQEANAATGKSQSESTEEKGVGAFYMWASILLPILSFAFLIYGLYIVIKDLSNNH